MDSVFISYAKEDFLYAEEIYNYLKEQGLNPWMDKKNLLANDIMIFGINTDFKITCITEQVLDYKFTKEKPLL